MTYDYENSAMTGGSYLREYITVYDYTWCVGAQEARVWAVRASNTRDAAMAVLEPDEHYDVDKEPLDYVEDAPRDGREVELTQTHTGIVSFDGLSVTLLPADRDLEMDVAEGFLASEEALESTNEEGDLVPLHLLDI